MSQTTSEPIHRLTFDADELVRAHPPRLRDRNKRIVYDMACPPGCRHEGRIVWSRWNEMSLPGGLIGGTTTTIDPREGLFDYAPSTRESNCVEWHMNFAHSDLFGFYDGSLLAQDELQVAEHPALASLREGLLAQGIRPLTVEDGRPTPNLIAGVERRCRIDTEPRPVEGRCDGLYGNRFADAEERVVRDAVTPIEPPTISNILAMEAPSYGQGAYTADEIRFILRTAYTGFSAARIESRRMAEAEPPQVVVHTGFWGCGAYGGDRTLMALLQIAAARLASVDRLVFHTHTRDGSMILDEALSLFDELAPAQRDVPLADFVRTVEAIGFAWGVSDGN